MIVWKQQDSYLGGSLAGYEIYAIAVSTKCVYLQGATLPQMSKVYPDLEAAKKAAECNAAELVAAIKAM